MNSEDTEDERDIESSDNPNLHFDYHLSDTALKTIRDLQTEVCHPAVERMAKLVPPAAQIMPTFTEFSTSLHASKAYAELVAESRQQMQMSLLNLRVNLKDYVPALQPQVFEATQRISQEILASMPKIDFAELSDTFKKAHDSYQFLRVLEEARWPLYLVDNDDMIAEIVQIDSSMEAEELKLAVLDVAARHLGVAWLDSTKDRWAAMDDISVGERILLVSALERHESGDYVGSVAILMCLFEGFTERLAKASSALANVDPELFDWEAEKHSMYSLKPERGKYRRLHAKDHVLLLLLQTEQGWYTWRAASNYIIDVVLVNAYDENLALHNPLRNKICHGVQTNYGTWEHSAKAILSTDMILRMGLAAIAAVAVNGSNEE